MIDSWTCANLEQPSTPSLFRVTTPSSSINEKEIQVFPNPASTQLMVELPISISTSPSTFTLLHVSGQVMLSQPVSTPLLELDIMDFPRGIYIAQWKDGDTVHAKRVLLVGN